MDFCYADAAGNQVTIVGDMTDHEQTVQRFILDVDTVILAIFV